MIGIAQPRASGRPYCPSVFTRPRPIAPFGKSKFAVMHNTVLSEQCDRLRFLAQRGQRMRRRDFISLVGGAAAWPLAARAQQAGGLRRIGVVAALTETDADGRARIEGFRQGLAKLGWIEGRTARIEYRWGAIDPNRARAYALELAAMPCDVIFVASAPAVSIFRDQIHTIPIVFEQAGDPVLATSAQSFARPGGNLTGFVSYEGTIAAKYLQLLKDIAPNITRAVVLQFENSTWRGDFAAIQAVAGSFGVTVTSAIVHNEDEITRAITGLAREPNGGLIFPGDNNTALHRGLIIALTTRFGLPAIYSNRSWTAGGGLISYGADQVDIYRRAASYVDRVLKGEKPADLPVQTPTKYELIINLNAAKAMGLSVSPTMLIAADEVFE
jgi:putative tryptophan/tyrosine transport system substrate-binding protein